MDVNQADSKCLVNTLDNSERVFAKNHNQWTLVWIFYKVIETYKFTEQSKRDP